MRTLSILFLLTLAITLSSCRKEVTTSESVPTAPVVSYQRTETTPPPAAEASTPQPKPTVVVETPVEPAPPAAQETVPPPPAAVSEDPQPVSQTVYITRTGECYHRDGCSSLRKSKIPTSVNEAQQQGYRPCQRCNP